MKVRLFAGVALAALIGASVPPPAPAAEPASVYETLGLMKDHAVMFVAVGEARQVTALRSEGPFTLFAPTDAAFKKLDDATIRSIATNKAAVKKLVRSHLFEGKLTTAVLKDSDGKERTLHGTPLKAELLKDGFRVGGVKVTTADILCSNGVIHVIDVVLPVPKD